MPLPVPPPEPDVRPGLSATAMTERPLRTTDVAFVVTLMTIGAALRFYRIDTGLWYDEILTLLESVRAPLREIVSQFPGDNHHPLYSVLGHLAVKAFGEHPWALRLPSALFGIATIALLWVLGRVVADRREAGAAALILTVSYHHIWFSQNARGYTAVLFCVLLSTYSLIRWFDTGQRRFVVLYALSTALGAYAHLTMVLVALGQALVCGFEWLAGGPDARARIGWKAIAIGFVGAALLTVLMYAPMLADIGSVMTGETSGGDKTTLSWTITAALQGLQAGFGTLWGIALGARGVHHRRIESFPATSQGRAVVRGACAGHGDDGGDPQSAGAPEVPVLCDGLRVAVHGQGRGNRWRDHRPVRLGQRCAIAGRVNRRCPADSRCSGALQSAPCHTVTAIRNRITDKP